MSNMAFDKMIGLPRPRHLKAVACTCGLALLAAACVKPEPRRFEEFMDDSIAREGTLARCNRNREETSNDIECANARRAASAVALVHEREQRAELERESERTLVDLRAQIERRDRAKREAMAAALAAAEAAYEAQWAGEGFEPGSDAVEFKPVQPPMPNSDAALDATSSSSPSAATIPRPFQ
jgi:hypothetical protein